MTKDELVEKYFKNSNYEEAQKRIIEAMKSGKNYVYLPGKIKTGDFDWYATEETIARLREDGFEIDQTWNSWEYWSVEWYD